MIFIEENDEVDISDIVLFNEPFLESEKYHNQYILGCCECTNLLFECGIIPELFFKSSYNAILTYLYYNSLQNINPKLEIIQIVIINDCFYANLKTYWIKLIQRHWKKTFKERKRIIEKRKSLEQMFFFQKYGKYLHGCNFLPGLGGMLSMYL